MALMRSNLAPRKGAARLFSKLGFGDFFVPQVQDASAVGRMMMMALHRIGGANGGGGAGF